MKRPSYLFLPFDPEIAPKVVNREVWASARYHRYDFYPCPREEFHAHSVNRPLEGLYYCRSRRKLPLGVVARNYYAEIGFDAPFSYEEIWCRICDVPRFNEDLKCDYYEFQRID